MAENRKGIQTAPKTFKRQHQVPAIPQISQKLGHMNSQAIGKPPNLNATSAQGAAKKDKNLLGYINKRMKLGDTQQILFNHAINDASPSHQQQHQGPSGAARPAYLQYEAAAERSYELAYLKTKKAPKSKKKPTLEGARNKSAPKRNPKKQGDVARSVPNNAVLNRLAQGKGPGGGGKGGRAAHDDEQPARGSPPRRSTVEQQRSGSRSTYLQPQPQFSHRNYGETETLQRAAPDSSSHARSHAHGRRSGTVKPVRSKNYSPAPVTIVALDRAAMDKALASNYQTFNAHTSQQRLIKQSVLKGHSILQVQGNTNSALKERSVGIPAKSVEGRRRAGGQRSATADRHSKVIPQTLPS